MYWILSTKKNDRIINKERKDFLGEFGTNASKNLNKIEHNQN